MKFCFNLSDPSTLRGLVWMATALIGFVFILMGRDVQPLLLFAGAVVGGLGVLTSDKDK